ncbi:NifU family protein [Propionispora vibrioides]|uniref:Fe-S cluster biogenesis protein NfuA, 4Fe-4S-binding domain n=1 Tax=Propionispora vibrioides TaxID=112903 RepID=A0A1H8X4V2_9FIRM|nr:NifU family protein [Propionispora vibrioides]SEP34942.1 Fe-S cluster biogenesis protein NfuA, 4Fe-4S-binding domain [Propionispora vibrioides]
MSENALEDKLKQVMDEKVRPLLAAHQGDIQVVDVKAGIVTVRLTGACATCPGSRSTVADIVETQIKEALPEIKKVVLVEQSVSSELIAEALRLLRHER